MMPLRHFTRGCAPYLFFIAVALVSLVIRDTAYAQSKEATVFDVRRPLAMENGDNPPKDYFFNAGSSDGLKKGMLVTVNRRQALYDQYLNKSPGDLVVAVGKLRIIHVQPDMSVARLESMQDRSNSPGVEFEAVMVGDKVDLSSARMPQKTASLDVNLQVLPVPPPVAPSMMQAPVIEKPALAPNHSKDFSSVAPQAPLNVNTAM
jgi:hypothetical protein